MFLKNVVKVRTYRIASFRIPNTLCHYKRRIYFDVISYNKPIYEEFIQFIPNLYAIRRCGQYWPVVSGQWRSPGLKRVLYRRERSRKQLFLIWFCGTDSAFCFVRLWLWRMVRKLQRNGVFLSYSSGKIRYQMKCCVLFESYYQFIDKKYWSYTLDQISAYDISANIQYVLGITQSGI